MPARNFRLLCLCIVCLITACRERPKSMSFYYWATAFRLDSLEDSTLRANDIRTLYIRYFDIDWPPADSAPVRRAGFSYGNGPVDFAIVPVVCVANRVFERLDAAAIPAFTADVFTHVRAINAAHRLQNTEIQFDCDWSGKTRENYFAFLREYHRISVQSVSATIRMNQLRDPERAGVPPVDHGALLYFNLEETDSGAQESVYERQIAHRYTPSLRSYPLTLDVALPVFSPGEEKKDGEDLYEMVSDINRHSNHRIRNLIFFDLDRRNLLRYDRNIYKEALTRID